jgi:hypothetical protein
MLIVAVIAPHNNLGRRDPDVPGYQRARIPNSHQGMLGA